MSESLRVTTASSRCVRPGTGFGPSRTAAALALLAVAAAPLRAQCPDGSPPPCGRRPAAISPRSVAILYFDNLSRDSADALLADGFTEELIVRLGRVESLEVKSRGLVQRYRAQAGDPITIGRALRVAYVVSGTMRRAGERVRVTAEMARTSDGTQVWADAFDRASSDLMVVEADLGQAVAGAIAGRLRPADRALLTRRPTRSGAAWEAFLRGNALIARRLAGGLPGALTAYREAVRLDPAFAAAWGRLAEALAIGATAGYLGGDSTERADRGQQALTAAARAMALDSTLPEAWLARGLVTQRPSDAIAAFARAVALDTMFAEGHYHLGNATRAWTDDQATAERHLLRAHVLDPSLVNAVDRLVQLNWQAGRTFEALAWWDTMTAMVPLAARAPSGNPLRLADIQIDLLLRAEERAAARAELEARLADPRGADTTGVLALAARVYADLGDSAEARVYLRRAMDAPAPIPTTQSAVLLASALAANGDRAQALNILENVRDLDVLRRPYFNSLRREPRFARLLEGARIR